MNRKFATICCLAVFAVFFGSYFRNVSAQEEIVEKSGTEQPGFSQVPPGHPLRVDDFQYATGALTDIGGANVSGGNWISNTGTGNFLQVSSGSLSYAGYPSSGIGNKLSIISTTASAEDTFRNFPTQTTGTTYAAFMVNVTDTTGLAANSSTTGDYFAGFINSSSTTSFVNRVTIRAGSVANTYQLGIRATSNAANVQTFSTTDLPVGSTALVVISYQIVAGAANDVCNMWINPTITGPEPAATLSQVSAADNTDVARFFIRQGSAGTPNASVDGLRVGTSWASLTAAYLSPALVDFNGDGKSDYAVIRNVGGQMVWYILTNGTGAVSAYAWGLAASDKPVPADFDGDGKSDIAVWRQGPQSYYYILQSATNTVKISPFGQNNDDTSVVGDYDGDGKADESVFRCPQVTPGQCVWYYRGSLNNPSGNIAYVPWGSGLSLVVQPAAGDYDGDGKFDFCVRTNSFTGVPGQFALLRSSDFGVEWVTWGLDSDAIVPRGDYDGDGRTDFAVVRVTTTYELYILQRNGGGTGATPRVLGIAGTDSGSFGDFDGDGKTDPGIWRPSTGQFWIIQSSNGAISGPQWGQSGDSVPAEWIFPNE